MTALTLYHSPGACSRVPLILLQAAQADFHLRIVKLQAGDNHSPEFLCLNAKGKVPVLERDGQVLTENMAISTWIASAYPQAQLMPAQSDGWDYAQALSWLSFGTSVLHPLIFRARMAHRVVEGESARASAKSMAQAELRRQLLVANIHLEQRDWLCAPHWMAPDVMLFWCTGRAQDCGLDLSNMPALRAHFSRLAADPRILAALSLEAQSLELR
jgi:glutathione S-transferase